MRRTLKKVIKHFIPVSLVRHMFRREHLSLDFPRVIGVNLNETKCILRCRMCPQYDTQPSKAKWILPETFHRLIDQLPCDRKITFEIASYGETLVTKFWKELILYQQKKRPDLETVLVTNGAILNDEVVDFLLAYPPHVLQVSVDAGTADSYEWLTGSTGYEKTVKNLKRLAEERAYRGLKRPILRTHIIEMKELKNDISGFLATWRGVVDEVNVRHLGNWGGLIDNNECTPLWTPPERRYPCVWPFFAAKIVPTGDVHKCFIHFLSGAPGLGNINKQTLEEIWHGKRIKEVRERLLGGRYSEEPMCENCNVWALFPNIWKPNEYKEGVFTGKRYLDMPYLFGEDGRDVRL